MKAILIGVKLDNVSEIDFNEEIEELNNLTTACEIEVCDTVKQNLESFNSLTYIGSGKIQEIEQYINMYDADVIICNDELTPLQISNLTEKLNISVFDRTYLILEIFKRRAKTKEAILQVEKASLSYLLPRLSGMRNGLSRQRGAGGAAHGKGAGETKLELDRRINKDKINAITKELKELEKIRRVQRDKRKNSDLPKVCLVGYTNAGKSTLLNKILELTNKNNEKSVFEKDMLFATLETSTRKINYEKGKFLLTDTVGFIEKLPHHLVEAFKSTLEEIKECDLILHIVDGSSDKFTNHIEATQNVLNELGVTNIQMIYVFNKIDKIENYLYIPNEFPNSIRVSAKNGDNINFLLDMIIKEVYKNYDDVDMFIPYGNEKDLYAIKDVSVIDKITYQEDGINVKCKVNQKTKNRFLKYISI